MAGLKSGMSGAMTGAGLGSAFGPMGMGVGAGIGGIVGLATDVFGGGDEGEELIKMQKQLAEDARLQRERQHKARLNSLGQSMLALNPMNQTMAQMFGPDAAFTPQEFANMARDPFGGPQPGPPPPGVDSDYLKRTFENGGKPPPMAGPDPREQGQRQREWEREEEARRQQIMQGMRPLPPAPRPVRPAPGLPVPAQRRF